MQFADPQSTVLQLGVRENMRVGDFGAGCGHHTFALSRIVGDDGHVYAIDVQEDVLKRLKQEATEQGLHNVHTIWADIEATFGTKLKDNILDAAVFSNTLFQLENREAAIGEIKRVLKPDAKLLVVDWAGCYQGVGPDEERVVEEHVAEKLFLQAGFFKEKSFRAGPHHWALVFRKPS